GAMDQRGAEDQGPGGRRGPDRLDLRRKISPPAGPGYGKVPGLGPGRALPDVVEVVGSEPGQLEGEVAVGHVRMGENDQLIAQIQPGQRVQGVIAWAAAVAVGRVDQAGRRPELVNRG